MDLNNVSTSTRNISIYETIKLLAMKLMTDHTETKTSAKRLKKLISVGYQAHLANGGISLDLDLSPSELLVAIMMETSPKGDIGELSDKNAQKLEILLGRLKNLTPLSWNPFELLKIFYILHRNFLSSQEKMVYSSHQITESEKCATTSSISGNESLEAIMASSKYKTWEIFGLGILPKKEPLIEFLDLHNEITTNDTSCFVGTYVSRMNLRSHVISALLGVPSSSFIMSDLSLIVNEGLFTDGIDSDTLVKMLQLVVKSGSCYLRLSSLREDDWSATSLSSFPSLKHFLELYCVVVNNLPYVDSVNSWLKYLIPISQQVEFISSCVHLLPDLKKFLESIYNFTIHDFLYPNLSLLMHTLLFDCCQTYVNLLNGWMFEGTWHKDLFIQKNTDLKDVSSKESWATAYSFIQDKAPKFLPCFDIYHCGRNVALLKICSKTDPFVETLLSKDNGRPRIKLCSSLAELKTVMKQCNEYNSLISILCADRLLKDDDVETHAKEESVPLQISLPAKFNEPITDFGPDRVFLSECNSVSEKSVANKPVQSSAILEVSYSEKGGESKGEKEPITTSNVLPDLSSQDEVNVDRLALSHRFEELLDDVESRRKHYLWQQLRLRHSYRKQFLVELHKPSCEGELYYLPNPSQQLFTSDPLNNVPPERIYPMSNDRNKIQEESVSVEPESENLTEIGNSKSDSHGSEQGLEEKSSYNSSGSENIFISPNSSNSKTKDENNIIEHSVKDGCANYLTCYNSSSGLEDIFTSPTSSNSKIKDENNTTEPSVKDNHVQSIEEKYSQSIEKTSQVTSSSALYSRYSDEVLDSCDSNRCGKLNNQFGEYTISGVPIYHDMVDIEQAYLKDLPLQSEGLFRFYHVLASHTKWTGH